jgi:glutaminyl-peptide cyclotransferase
MVRSPLVASAALLALTPAGCGSGDPRAHNQVQGSMATAPQVVAARSPDRFDAGRAFALTKLQVSYGQRPAGSPQLRRLAERLVIRLPRGHFENVPGQPGVRNIVGTLPGRRPAIVIGAHYDTLVQPAGFVGANNGAAGSAVVIELARALARTHRPKDARQVRFVLFDGEEPPAGLPEDDPNFTKDGLRGSRAYVKAHPHDTKAMILLDYVGNRGLQLPHEGTSTGWLWRRLRAAAERVDKIGYFPPGDETPIIDDHTPFLESHVPAVDLIDWRYPGHSLQDGMDKIDRDSLDAVGETVLQLVRELRAS